MKYIYIVAFTLLYNFSQAQLKSPDMFLGYPLGSKWTSHHKVVDYINYVATQIPNQVKLKKYGETHEGRPLYLLFVSNENNITNLEKIREQNIAYTGTTKIMNPIKMPSICWMSYNVHGNETSSTEVSMKFLYELLTGKSKTYLDNTLVIIDPCLNPDGRERYINWFNSVVGKKSNAALESREHSEPWPTGRVNHYYFDLNRDWVWQTQPETKARIKEYLTWMPHIHCDFHEQGIESPYYFAPAAEPMHEAITPWQRSFQVDIGKNHAGYFDANGWLYFTKELFDLFYPGYGDTYPMFNGSIGMTYEQAGHTTGGLQVLKSDGEIMSLNDRIAHHFTTSTSTIEIASKNNEALTSNFVNYFKESNSKSYTGYNGYFITDNSYKKIKQVQDFLTQNNIQSSFIIETPIGNAYKYSTQKQEKIEFKSFTLAVKGIQPQGKLLNILMEAKPKLSDTATYDITSWAVPFVFNVEAFATNSFANYKLQESYFNPPIESLNPNSRGFLITYNSIDDSKILGKLLSADFKVRYSESDFNINNSKYKKGSLILLASTKIDKEKAYNFLIKNNIQFSQLTTGFMDKGPDLGSSKIHLIRKPKIALVSGKQSYANSNGEAWHFIEQTLDYPVSLINADELDDVSLKNYNVLIFTNGNYKNLADKDQFSDIKSWVRKGGTLIVLENAVKQLASLDIGLVLKKAEEVKDEKEPKIDYNLLKKYENRDRDGLEYNIPGVVMKVELDATNPLAYGYDNTYYTLKQDGNFYDYLKNGWNVGAIKKNPVIFGHAGYKAKEKFNDAMVIGLQPFGNGNIVMFTDNIIFRNFWKGGEMFFANAMFMVGN